jgi:hypothetical protein
MAYIIVDQESEPEVFKKRLKPPVRGPSPIGKLVTEASVWH